MPMFQQDNFEQLVADAEHTPLVLFLGAGIMCGTTGHKNLTPLWKDLLAKLIDYALDLRFGGEYDACMLTKVKDEIKKGDSFTYYDQASLVKILLGDRYLSVLHQVLYSGLPEKYRGDELEANLFKEGYPLLHQILRLCQVPDATKKGYLVRAIVTYNYDDILERALPRAFSVGGETHHVPDGQRLPIYHIHGYLPVSSIMPDSLQSSIILSQDDYFHNMMQPYSWQTTTQLHFLINATCLFVGVSLTDVNMLRILNFAKNNSKATSRYVLLAKEEYLKTKPENTKAENSEINSFILRLKSTLFHDTGLRVIYSDTYGGLPNQLERLCSKLNPEEKGT